MSIKRIAIRAAVKAAKNPKIRKAVGEKNQEISKERSQEKQEFI